MKERNAFFSNVGLCMKLALVTLLMIGGGNFAWAQKGLPYSYGFENNNLAGEGWTIVDGISDNTKIYTSGASFPAKSGSYTFGFYMGYNKTEYLISPLLESSATGIDFSFYYKNITTYSTETFYVGYSTTDASSFTWLEDALTPAASMSEFIKYSVTINNSSVKYVAIKHVSGNSHRVFIDDITIEAAETYKRPKALNVSSYTSISATLSWTPGDDESAWQIAYSTDKDFNPDDATLIDVTSNPYTLTRLEETTYYAYIRSIYIEEDVPHYSGWSNIVEFTPGVNPTIGGSNTNSYVPIIDKTYCSDLMQSQFIIPESEINDLQGRRITGLTFFTSQSTINWNGATFEVYLNIADKTTYSAARLDNFVDWGTKVFNSGVLSVSDGKMVVEFNTPFDYANGNLMIGFKQTAISGAENNTTAITSTWYGTNLNYSDYAAIYYGMGYSSVTYSRSAFIPKVCFSTISLTTPATIGSTGYTTFSSAKALNLDELPDGLNAYYVASDAIGDGKAKLTAATGNVSAGTGLILKGTAGDTYQIPVAESGDAISGNLLVGCTTPKALTTNANYYVLVKYNDAPVFQSLENNGATIPAGKAYLNVPGEARSLQIVIDDGQTTGISDASRLTDNGKMRNDNFFNLNGQRVAQPTKGLYIKNGKKVVMK